MFLLTELLDQQHATRTGVQDQNQGRPPPTGCEKALWTNGISWMSASSTKPLESGKTDFKLVWLQEEDSLNISCELLTFCQLTYVIFEW